MGQASSRSYQSWAVFNLWIKIPVMDLYLTVLDQDSGLKGIRPNLDGEKWFLLISAHTLVYRDGNTPISTHTHTSYLLMFSVNLRPARWLHPGTLQAFSMSTYSTTRALPSYLLTCQLVQVKTIHTIFQNCSEETLPKNLPSVSEARFFLNICSNLFPAFLCHIPIFYILSLLHMWVFMRAHVCERDKFS